MSRRAVYPYLGSDIYDQHKAAFAHVSAYVILDASKERVATIAFKYPRDGSGRLYAYVHWIGIEMVRGFASGGGYDKHSAACEAATRKMPEQTGLPYAKFRAALVTDDGHYWYNRLQEAGFTVLQAV